MKKLRIIIVLVGLVLIAYPIAGKLYAEKMQKFMYENLYKTANTIDITEDESLLASNEYEELQRAFEYNNSDIINTNGLTPDPMHEGKPDQPIKTDSPDNESKPVIQSGQVMGRMLIDKINIDIPIVEGVSPENLKISLGHLPGSSLVGEIGNTVIAGHRSHTFGYYFNRLDEMDVNDEVVIDTGSRTYRYVVYQKKVVEPTDTSVLKRSKTLGILTLVTCHPLYSSKQRLIVHAYLVD